VVKTNNSALLHIFVDSRVEVLTIASAAAPVSVRGTRCAAMAFLQPPGLGQACPKLLCRDEEVEDQCRYPLLALHAWRGSEKRREGRREAGREGASVHVRCSSYSSP